MKVAGFILVLGACGGGSGAASDAAAPSHHGGVWIVSDSYHAQNVARGDGAAGATFADGGGLCTTQASFGACDVSWCNDVQPPFTAFSAGTVTISGAAIPISLVPDPMQKVYLQLETTNQALFAGGESLGVVATGADVPAFTASFVTPTKPTITSPAAPPEQTALTVARSSDFKFTWTGFATGTLHAHVSGGPNASTVVDCTFDAAAGTGTIPTRALMMVPTGGLTQFGMEAIRDTEVDAGDWAVTLHAWTQAVWPTDTLAGGLITLE